MERLLEIKRRVDDISEDLNVMYPRYKADKAISDKVTELKEYAQSALKEIQGQLKRGELTPFEKHFVEPAIYGAYMKGIDKIRKGAKPSARLTDLIYETDSTIGYWICEIEAFQKKEV
ncbi:hypothetical protein [Serratia sp. JSRIV004]|uniref:hypothetical protein n=1 Tax=unclassified Serratia (in: enterobacteria) TaxID=2647522 RepID=UPI001CC0BBDF|nr:hypothetical protein [Serratia sp. JSRIV004]UAN56975.1 hypothetical protein KGP21_25755 [Serratia sp. JSRIV004]